MGVWRDHYERRLADSQADLSQAEKMVRIFGASFLLLSLAGAAGIFTAEVADADTIRALWYFQSGAITVAGVCALFGFWAMLTDKKYAQENVTDWQQRVNEVGDR